MHPSLSWTPGFRWRPDDDDTRAPPGAAGGAAAASPGGAPDPHPLPRLPWLIRGGQAAGAAALAVPTVAACFALSVGVPVVAAALGASLSQIDPLQAGRAAAVGHALWSATGVLSAALAGALYGGGPRDALYAAAFLPCLASLLLMPASTLCGAAWLRRSGSESLGLRQAADASLGGYPLFVSMAGVGLTLLQRRQLFGRATPL